MDKSTRAATASANPKELGFKGFKVDKKSLTRNHLIIAIPGNKSEERLEAEIRQNLVGLEGIVAFETDERSHKIIFRIIENKKGERVAATKLLFSDHTSPGAHAKFADDDYMSMGGNKVIRPEEIARFVFTASCHLKVDSTFSINVEEEASEADLRKIKIFEESCKKSYSTPVITKSRQHKMIVGENHDDSDAVNFIISLLPELSKTKTPIFLEFLEWEIHQELLEKYHAEIVGSEEERQLEGLVKIAIEGITRRRTQGLEGSNEDLFRLVVEAKKAGVRIFPAESILSYQLSSRSSGDFEGHRCYYANYGVKEVVNATSPDNFVILIGNAHLLTREQKIAVGHDVKLDEGGPLQDLFGGAHVVSFAGKGKDAMQKAAPNISCFSGFREGEGIKESEMLKFKKEEVVEPVAKSVMPPPVPKTPSGSRSPARFPLHGGMDTRSQERGRGMGARSGDRARMFKRGSDEMLGLEGESRMLSPESAKRTALANAPDLSPSLSHRDKTRAGSARARAKEAAAALLAAANGVSKNGDIR